MIRTVFFISLLLLAGCSEWWCWPFDCSSSSSTSSGSTTATGDLQGASNAAPTTPGTQRFKLEMQQTYKSCKDCGFFFDSAELVIKHSAGTLRRNKKGPFWVRKDYDLHGRFDWDISAIPQDADIEKATLYMLFNDHRGIAVSDYTSVMKTYGWIGGKKTLIRTESAKDIKAMGCNKVNRNCPFDFTNYTRKILAN